MEVLIRGAEHQQPDKKWNNQRLLKHQLCKSLKNFKTFPPNLWRGGVCPRCEFMDQKASTLHLELCSCKTIRAALFRLSVFDVMAPMMLGAVVHADFSLIEEFLVTLH